MLDPIDQRHKAILPDYVWGDGDPAGVNQRAIEEMKNTARAAQKFGVGVVNGFTGSSIWHLNYSFPPVPEEMIEAGFQQFADRWNPILDVFDECGIPHILMLREELSQFLTDNGVFRDVVWYVDLLCAKIYADYIAAQGGVVCLVDGGHSAGTEDLLDLVVADRLPAHGASGATALPSPG